MLPSYRQNAAGNQIFDVDNFFNTPVSFNDPFADITSWRTSNPTGAPFIVPSMSSSTTASPPSGRLSTKSPFPQQQQQDKYRLTMTIHGYNREDIKTYIENERLIVLAKHVEYNGDDYQLREFKRHFFVPKNVDSTRMTTCLTRDNMLIVEIPVNLPAISKLRSSNSNKNFNQPAQIATTQTAPPRFERTRSNSAASTADYYPQVSGSAFSTTGSIRGSETELNRKNNKEQDTNNKLTGVHDIQQFDFEKFFSSPFNPSIVDSPDSHDQKKLEMKIDMHQYTPDQIHLELKDRELTLQIQDSFSSDYSAQDAANHSQHTYKVLLPPKVDLNNLKSKLEDGILHIEAPYLK